MREEKVDELTMQSLGFGILCNFPPCCGEERTKEAYNIFLSMKNEIMEYRETEAAKHAHFVVGWLGSCTCSRCKSFADYSAKYCGECGARFDEPEEREE